VIAPASTGNDKRSKIAVNKTDHTKSLSFSADSLLFFKFRMVVIKFKAPKIEETPAK
jgi:hypothetical protein